MLIFDIFIIDNQLRKRLCRVDRVHCSLFMKY